MHDDQDQLPISKTKRKQEMLALQQIGEEIVKLNPGQLDKLQLPSELYEAVIEAKKIHQRGALRRQLQYIGKLMRNIDTSSIKAKLDEWHGTSREQAIKLHRVEQWRDRLLADETGLAAFVADYPNADAQHLRNLIRNAHKEYLANKPPKNSRLLFKVINELIYGI